MIKDLSVKHLKQVMGRSLELQEYLRLPISCTGVAHEKAPFHLWAMEGAFFGIVSEHLGVKCLEEAVEIYVEKHEPLYRNIAEQAFRLGYQKRDCLERIKKHNTPHDNS